MNNKFLIVAIAMLFSIAQATVWYVHPDSTLDSIQPAINMCTIGDTVLVGPGTYVENIVWPFAHGIDLVSEYGPDTTIIDGDSAGRVITITYGVDTTTVIRGFTIRNGYVYDLDGGGIYCNNASPRIVSNVFSANSAGIAGVWPIGGGAIACVNYSSAVIDSNTMVGNHATYGGAIHLYNYCDAVITNNIIIGNSSDSTGGGIDIWNMCDATVTGNTINDNAATWGGGVFVANWSSPVVNGNVIHNNVTQYAGGIHCIGYAIPTITDNVITENTGALGTGGIWFDMYASGVIEHCIISNNTGYGMCIRQSSPEIDSCAIEYNTSWGIFVPELQPANPTVNWCNIVGNQGAGLVNFNALVTIDAENNWWGDTSGPGGAGPGTGNPVSNYVDFDPWLTDSVQGIGIEEVEIVEPMVVNMQVRPNPFRHTTNIRFTLHDTGSMIENPELTIYDATGRLVKDFRLTPGALRTTLSWDGRDDHNRMLPSGIYFLKLESGHYQDSEKLILLR